MTKNYWLGCDVGSMSTEVVLIKPDRSIAAYIILATGASASKAAQNAYDSALKSIGVAHEEINGVVATGYGRARTPFPAMQVTEITCHAKGISAVFPEVRTVLDIGGQDSKAIKIDADGSVRDFAMNDKCAAGTGRFLEVMARTLEIDLEELGPLSLQADHEVTVSSLCTVFAESEVVSLISEGKSQAQIARGICKSIADRTASLLERVGIIDKVAMSGGVAKNTGVVRALCDRIGREILIPYEPQIIGAYGAALIAKDRSRVEK